MHKKEGRRQHLFEKISLWAVRFTGSSTAFTTALVVIILWAVTGPIFNYSESWQLVINTGTTIITFLMVFLIQKTQNKDAKAIHLKLNEIIAAHEGTSNRMVDIEDLSEAELDQLHRFYERLAQLAKKDTNLLQSHSIDAAEEVSKEKLKTNRGTRSSALES
jgi:low affinity Fe/Cu permease